MGTILALKVEEALGSESSRSPGFEEAGIDGLQAGVVVDLLGAFAFEDDGWDADGAVPDGEVGYGVPEGRAKM